MLALHLRRRAGAGDALPFATRHLDPGINPALVSIYRLAIALLSFALPRAGGNGRVPRAKESRGHFPGIFDSISDRLQINLAAQNTCETDDPGAEQHQ